MNLLKLLRLIFVSHLVILLLISCGIQSNSQQSYVITSITPSKNIYTEINAISYVKVVFNSNNESSVIKNLTVNLSSLPQGWSSISGNEFSCAEISATGNGCQLILKFAPNSLNDKGKLHISYSFTENYFVTGYGEFEINYTTTSANNISWVISPTPPINATVGAPQFVSILFNTDNGVASNFSVDISNLPKGWSSLSGPSYNCALVTNIGNSCQAFLYFDPTGIENGIVNLPITYLNSQSISSSNSVSIIYSASKLNQNPNQSVITGPSEVHADLGGKVVVTIDLNSNFGVLTNLSFDLTNLSTSFPGWRSDVDAHYTCDQVFSTGNGCQLILTFAPTSLEDSGVLTIPFYYINNLSKKNSSVIDVQYSTVNFNSVYTVSPNQVHAKKDGSKTITIVFKTDNGIATDLNLNLSDLSTNYPGWSSYSTSFNCSTITTNDEDCVLMLNYTPTSIADKGVLNLPYSYINNAKVKVTPNFSLKYKTTRDNSLSAFPSSLNSYIPLNTIQYQTIYFIVDYGVVSDFAIETAPQAGWTLTENTCNGSFSSCYVTYAFDSSSYAAFANGSFNINYSYNNNVHTNISGNELVNYFVTPNSTVNYSPIKTIINTPYGTSKNATFTLTAQNAGITNLQYTLQVSSDIIVDSSATNCSLGMSLNAGESCSITVTFTPTSSIVNSNGIISYTYNNSAGESQGDSIYFFYLTPSSLYTENIPTSISTIPNKAIQENIIFHASNGNINGLQITNTNTTGWSFIRGHTRIWKLSYG